MKTVRLEIKNYSEKKRNKLKKACIDRKCEYKDIVEPAVDDYLSTNKKLKQK